MGMVDHECQDPDLNWGHRRFFSLALQLSYPALPTEVQMWISTAWSWGAGTEQARTRNLSLCRALRRVGVVGGEDVIAIKIGCRASGGLPWTGLAGSSDG